MSEMRKRGGTTFAGTFRHLGTDYKLVGPRHPEYADYDPQPGKPWMVVELATGKVWRYKTFQGAWLRRKAEMAGVSIATARGLPS